MIIAHLIEIHRKVKIKHKRKFITQYKIILTPEYKYYLDGLKKFKEVIPNDYNK